MIFALCLILSGPVAAQGATTAEQRLVTNSGVRLRESASREAAILDKIAIGTIVVCAEKKDGFCRTTIGDKTGWYFAELTAPLAKDSDAQIRDLIASKTKALAGAQDKALPDLYEFDRFLLNRIEAAYDPKTKARAKLDELRVVIANAEAFKADPRVRQDESQGARVKRELIWALADEAKGTDVAEEAAWLAVELGRDGECEGYAGCIVDWWNLVECGYLKRFPDGPHAKDAVARMSTDARWIRENPEFLTEMSAEDKMRVKDQVGANAKCASKSPGYAAFATEVDALRKALAH